LTTLAIAGWRIRLECASSAIDEAIAARYDAFVVPDGAAHDAWVTVSLDPDVPGGEWPARIVTRQGDVCLFDMPDACGRILLSAWQADLRLRRENSGDLLEYFLKSLFAYLAFHRGGLLFHSAGILVDSEVFLFTGEGGSGKSTVVSLSPDRLALNDDLVILLQEGQGWRAYGTPFWNILTSRTRRSGQTADGLFPGAPEVVLLQQRLPAARQSKPHYAPVVLVCAALQQPPARPLGTTALPTPRTAGPRRVGRPESISSPSAARRRPCTVWRTRPTPSARALRS